MRKLFALFHNEMIKILSKTATWILIGIMVISQLGLGAMLKFTGINRVYYVSDEDLADYMEIQKENLKELEAEENKLKYIAEGETDPMEKLEVLNDLAHTQARIYVNKFATDNNMAIDSYNNFMTTCFENLVELKSNEYLYELSSDMIDGAMKDNPLLKAGLSSILDLVSGNKAKIADYEDIILNGDYKKYIRMSNDEIYKDNSKTKEEKDIEVYCNNLRLKVDPTGKSNNWEIEETIRSIGEAKRSLLHNINYVFNANMNAPLTEDEKIQIKNQLAVKTYTIEHGILTADSKTEDVDSYPIMFNIGLMFVIVLTMILAGSSISQEIATGSIKSLIISPVKRWKIFTAKLLSVLVTAFAATLILYAASSLSALLFFGKDYLTPYVFAVNGVARELGFFSYRFAQAMVSFIDVVVYMLLAMMLSAVTRNTAVSVAVPIGVYFSSSIVVAFTRIINNDLIVKFIPLTNLDLQDKFFPFTNYSVLYVECLKHSLRFSLIYIAVMCVCMLVTALDSFNRRDLT